MNIIWKFAILAIGLAAVVECVMNYQQSNRYHGPSKSPTQFRVHRSGPPPGQQMRYRNPVKRVYVPLKYMPHHNGPITPNHRPHHQHKIRYGPPAQTKRSPAGPPPGWKPKRLGPPPLNYSPPRKTRTPKPPKYQKPYNKVMPNKYDSYGKPAAPHQVVTDSYGAPKPMKFKVTSTTYGIPHPTLGSPEPPKKEDSSAATSYVQVYQGDKELEAKTSYSFTNTHSYPEKHKGKVYDDLTNHRPVYNHNSTTTEQTKNGFQPPKQTYGFQPYDDADDFSLTPSQGGYYGQTNTQQKQSSNQQTSKHTSTQSTHNTEEFLSPSYFDQKS